jgi:hypothetical protein
MLKAWRGAALQDGSSIGLPEGSRFVAWQLYRFVSRRLPGMNQRKVLPIASIGLRGYNGP